MATKEQEHRAEAEIARMLNQQNGKTSIEHTVELLAEIARVEIAAKAATSQNKSKDLRTE